ncbi:MAG: glycosyltransferase [Candidatus Marinimicrobia bacterium]|nr:glycosyltransferase [Candidatus Neomarinimicrobiota bacterium]
MTYFFIVFVIFFLYVGSILLFIIGNFRNSAPTTKRQDSSVSVIVAVRNGERSLQNLLLALSRQSYSGKLEFIIVDDESTDNTENIIRQIFARDDRFKYVSSLNSVTPGLSHKKRALDAGIISSDGDILLFTDVDCRMGEHWVQTMVSYFAKSVDYVIGFTQTNPQKSIASIFQAVDLHMLMACTRATTQLGFPLASTGQNQAYKRQVFEKSGGYSLLKDHLQGDDSLFLQIARSRSGGSVVFASSSDSFVTGRTETSWRQLLMQRIRWAGDTVLMWKYNRLFFLYLAVVFLTNVMIFLSLFGFYSSSILALLLIIKFGSEYAFFHFAKSQFNSNLRWPSFVIWFIINIPYIVTMGTMSAFGSKFKWHGRKLQT